MELSTIIIALAVVASSERIPADEIQHQQDSFKVAFGDAEFVWKFDDLPKKGGVPKHRIPYSGYIYPDRQGGTTAIMRKYDAAFHGRQRKAAEFEHWDSTAFKEKVPGLFGDVFGIKHTPDWWGHCNGWTAATIRHAEPQRTVIRNGVAFTPSDIKGLLAELYIYNEHIVLGGENEAPITAGAFHAIIANWLGRMEQAVGMESDPTKEKWNYPAYAFSSTSAKRSKRHVEVNLNLVFAFDSDAEWDESPRFHEVKFFHYMLELDTEGNIVGGYFLADSSSIDMLWYPVAAREPGGEGNEDGNPHLSREKILSIWHDSVSPEVHKKWLDKWASAARDEVVASVATSEGPASPTEEVAPAGSRDNAHPESSPLLSRYITVPKPQEGCRPVRRPRTDATDSFNALLRVGTHPSPTTER